MHNQLRSGAGAEKAAEKFLNFKLAGRVPVCYPVTTYTPRPERADERMNLLIMTEEELTAALAQAVERAKDYAEDAAVMAKRGYGPLDRMGPGCWSRGHYELMSGICHEHAGYLSLLRACRFPAQAEIGAAPAAPAAVPGPAGDWNKMWPFVAPPRICS